MQQGESSIGRRLAKFIAALVLMVSSPAVAQVRYVRAAAVPGGNGLSWATAFNDLQAALSAAAADSSITQLWLASGTYKPAGPGGRRTATFHLRDGLAIYGGFNGSETALNQRNITLNVATLSGDLNGDDLVDPIALPAWLNDNSFHVVNANGVGSTARLDGVTVRGGGATLNTMPNNGGGGLICVNGAPTIVRCTFTRNYALHRGGAMNLADTDNATIANCDFSFNRTFSDASTDDGGGAICITTSDTAITDCTFTSNRAVGAGPTHGGGAIRNNLGSPRITRCTFTSNRHNNYGGAFDNSGGSPVISQCTFQLNQSLYGGGVRSGGGAVTIRGSTFKRGFAVDIGDGAYFVGGSHMVVGCLFDRLLAGDGGAGLALSDGANAVVVNCRFVGNAANLFGGAAIWNFDSSSLLASLTVSNCEFSGNQTSSTGAPGAAIRTDSAATTRIVNCTFANNSLPSGSGGGAAAHSTGTGALLIRNSIDVHNTPSNFFSSGGGQLNVRYSSIEGGWAGPGNIATSSPGFSDENGADNVIGTPDDDLRLIASSSCIDAARNEDVQPDVADIDGDGDVSELTPLDLASERRFYDAPATIDTGDGTAPLVDMGAHEFLLACPADIAFPHDGNVNTEDLLMVVGSWGPCVSCGACPGDIAPLGSGGGAGGNCVVNTDDLLMVIVGWGACP